MVDARLDYRGNCWHDEYEELKMAFVNRKLVCAIFVSSQMHTSSSLRSGPVLFPDPETKINWISLLFCSQAEICVRCVISYLLPVDGRHFLFPIYPDTRQYSHLSLRVARPRKLYYNRQNFVVIVYGSWGTRHFIFYFRFMAAISIYDTSKHRTVFPLVSPCCTTLTTGVGNSLLSYKQVRYLTLHILVIPCRLVRTAWKNSNPFRRYRECSVCSPRG